MDDGGGEKQEAVASAPPCVPAKSAAETLGSPTRLSEMGVRGTQVPDVPLAVVAGILFTISGVSLFANIFRNRHWWGLCLPIGSLCKSSSTSVQSLKGDNIDAVIYV